MTSFFDEHADTWDDDPVHVERAARVAAGIRERVALDPTMRLLEYGAGTGLVAQELQREVGPITLADASPGMREVAQRKIGSGVIARGRVWGLDLARDAVPDETFDLIVTVQVLHHIPTLGPVLAGFAALLAEGGVLCVADLEAEDGSFHGDGFEGHHGFDRAALRSQVLAAGFDDVEFEACGTVARPSGVFRMFLMTARRAARG